MSVNILLEFVVLSLDRASVLEKGAADTSSTDAGCEMVSRAKASRADKEFALPQRIPAVTKNRESVIAGHSKRKSA